MKPRLILALVAIITGLVLADKFLASLEHGEVRREAESLYSRGTRLLEQGSAAVAIESLQRAHTLARSDRLYELALARAFLAAGRLKECESHLRHLLERDSNDGATNLIMARLEARYGNDREAGAYYHRALYGTWATGSDRQGEVRIELADFLAERGEQKQLLSELLLLQDESIRDAGTRRKIASLLLKAGSPEDAADAYRSLIQQSHNDVEAYLGLAEAELTQGNFYPAQLSLRTALNRKPDDTSIEERLQFASQLNALDPTPRRLPSKQKYSRSTQVLELAKADLTRCAQQAHAEEKIQSLMVKAEREQKVRKQVTNEMAESLLDLAQELWREQLAMCGSASVRAGDPLPLLMRKLAR